MPDNLTIAPGAKEIPADSAEAQEAEQASRQTAVVVASIPTSMWSKHGGDIAKYIYDEISRAEGERASYLDDVARWKILYDAPIDWAPRRFPFANASNITVPMIKEIVNTLASQVVQSTMTAEPRWILKDLSPEWDPFVHPVERFLNIAAEREVGYDEALIPAIIEMVKLGTQMLETVNVTEMVRSHRYTPDGKSTYVKEFTKRDGPLCRRIPISNFWIRFQETEIQEAMWVAKEHWLNKQQVIQRAARKGWPKDKLTQVLNFRKEASSDDEPLKAEEEITNTEPTDPEMYQIFEVHLRWDIDDDPDHLMEDIVVDFSRDLNSVLAGQFADYWDGMRPFTKLGYFPRADRFYDEGLAEMLEQIQIAVSATQNRRSDNAMMANLKMIIKRRSVKGLMPGDPLYAGKVIEVNDINNDMREFRMSEIYPSTVSEEQILRGYAERLSGFNDAVAGAAQPVSRTTATAQLALLQEQARRLDLTIRGVRKTQKSIGRTLTALYQQHGTLGKGIAWLGESGRAVEAIFSLPRRAVELGSALTVNVPTSTQNQQVRRESALSTFNLLNQMYQQLLPLTAQFLPPDQLAMVVQEMVAGSRTFMQDVLESFDASNPDEVLSALTLLERLLPDARDLGGLENFERAEAAAEITTSLSRVETLLVEAQAASRGGGRELGSSGDSAPNVPDAGPAPSVDAGLFLGG